MPVQIMEDRRRKSPQFLLVLSWHLTDVINQNWSGAAIGLSAIIRLPPRQRGSPLQGVQLLAKAKILQEPSIPYSKKDSQVLLLELGNSSCKVELLRFEGLDLLAFKAEKKSADGKN